MVQVTFSDRPKAVKYEAKSISIRNGRTTLWGPIYIVKNDTKFLWTKGGNGGKRYDRQGLPTVLESE